MERVPYNIGDRVSIIPDTESWRNARAALEEYNDVDLSEVNEWRVDDVEHPEYDGDYDMYLVNNNAGIETMWVHSSQVELLAKEDLTREIVIGDTVVLFDEGRINSTVGRVDRTVIATVVRQHSLSTAWYIDIDGVEYAVFKKEVRLATKKEIGDSDKKYLFSEAYPFVKEILTDMYGENYDIVEQLSSKDRYNAEIILKYPEVTISNSNNERHIIKDLYVKLRFTSGKLHQGLQGWRGLHSAKEYQVNYSHSHLPKRQAAGWESFCLGSGTETQFTLAEASSEFTETNFMLLLAMIDSYVSYESIEGGPHIKMSAIRTSEARRGSSIDYYSEYRHLVDNITDNLPLKYVDNGYIPTLELDTTSKEFDILMNKYIRTKEYRNKTNGMILDKSVSTLDVEYTNKQLIESYDCHIVFKGQKVYKTIEPEVVEEIDMSLYEEVAHPYVVSQITELLKEELKKFLL